MNLISRAAIIGIGVDTLHLPRLVSLLTRQSRRLQISKTSTSGPIQPLAIATQRFAHRILHEKEQIEWRDKFADSSHLNEINNDQLRWLASRWAVKEAAFKAIPNHLIQFSWHDAYLTKINHRPTLCHAPEIEKTWKEAGFKGDFPKLHVSITHDGDYLTAFVVAEG